MSPLSFAFYKECLNQQVGGDIGENNAKIDRTFEKRLVQSIVTAVTLHFEGS